MLGESQLFIPAPLLFGSSMYSRGAMSPEALYIRLHVLLEKVHHPPAARPAARPPAAGDG